MKEYVWPIVREELEDYYDMMLNCAKCKYCQNVFPLSATFDERFARQCPSGDYFKFEAYYASGRLELARGILEGTLEWSDKAREILFSCTGCGACEENCRTTQRLTPFKIIRKMKERYIMDGNPLFPAHENIVANIKRFQNPFGRRDKRFSWFDYENGSYRKDSTLLYFVGCATCYNTPDIAKSTCKVFDTLGVNYTVLGEDEACCGSPLFNIGLLKEGAELLRECIRKIESTGVKKVVFSDPQCYATFRKYYLFDIPEPNFEMQHISEYLLPILKEGNFLIKEMKGNAVFHDSSLLARHLRCYEEPRELLRMIPGLRLEEFFRNRLNTYCIAGNITITSVFPEMSAHAASVRLAEAKAVGADTIICTGPDDYSAFSALNQNEIKVKELSQILCEALEGVK